MKKIVLLTVTIIYVLTSCEQKNEQTVLNENMSIPGKWKVTASINGDVITEPFIIETSENTLLNNDSITLTDVNKDFWDFRVKAAVDDVTGTFETQRSLNENYDLGIGVIVSKGVIDANNIYFEIQFEDDETPYGNIYILKGDRLD